MEAKQTEATQASASPQPKYFTFRRKTMGVLDTTKYVLESSAIGTLGVGVIANERATAIISLVLVILRLVISRIVSVSEISPE